ncbi:unnamed protein product [Euphydryas editha]|uniref:Uncharacterized protein n=1 Tax=Euphydryas editha TaxID=104508 RepID=A0AAU9UCX2_EUPED|nr:unnamed protein product [Euphydryas editha]
MTEPDKIEILQHRQNTKENTSFNNLNEICIKSEMVPQESDDEEEHNNLEIMNFETFDKLQNEPMPSVDELINQIKTEVDNDYNAHFVEPNEYHETDDDDDDEPLINLQEDTERKRKLSALKLNDYEDSFLLKRFKTEVSDSLIVETIEPKQNNTFDPIVYTKRLDDMIIFQNNFKGMKRSDIWNKVLYESKPKYKNLEQTTNLPRPKCKHKDIQKLHDDIKKINSRRRRNKHPKMQSIEAMKNKEITSQNTEESLCRSTIKVEESSSNNAIIDSDLKSYTVFDTIDLFHSDDEVTEPNKTIASLNNVELPDVIDLTDSNCDENCDELPKTSQSAENIESLDLTESLPERRTSDVKDTAIVVPERPKRSVHFALVYTTRLNDMLILRDKLRYLDGKYVLNEIIRESKPNMNYFKPSIVSRGISLSRLQIKLAILNYKNKSSNNSGKIRYGSCSFISTDLFTRELNQSDFTKILIDSETYNDIKDQDDDINRTQESDCFIYNTSTKSIEEIDVYRNIAFFIYNKYSNLLEMFVTDYKGNVIEFRKSKIRNFSKYIDDFKYEVNSYKRIIKLTACCWFRRKINLIWTKTNKGITRFVKSTHRCSPRNCKCCCKPKADTSSFKFSLGINKDVEFKYDQKEKGNLIRRALVCRKPIKVMSEIENLTNEEPLVVKIKREPTGIYRKAEDHYLVYPSGRIDWRISLNTYNYSLGDVQQLIKFVQNTSKVNVIKCDINEEKTLISKLKEFNVSSNLIKYFRSGKVLKNNGETLTKINAPELKLTIDVPNIGHTRNTRKCTVAKLIKIKDILNDNTVINKETKINRNKKNSSLENDSHINLKRSDSKDINTALKNPQRLIVTCQNIPEIEVIINEVDASVAAVIINEFQNIFFALKTGKVVATIKSQVESTASKEFLLLAKIVHQIHLTTQNLNLPPDLQIQLNIRSEPINVETKEEKSVTQKKIVRKTVVKKSKRKKVVSKNKNVEIKKDNCVVEKTVLKKSKTKLDNSEDINVESKEDNCVAEKKIVEKITIQKSQPKIDTYEDIKVEIKEEKCIAEEKIIEKKVIEKSNLQIDTHEDIRNTVHKYDTMFTQFLSNDKKIHKNAFELYIKNKNKDGNKTENPSLPKIAKVFTLNDNKSTDAISNNKESIPSYLVSDSLCHDIETEMIRIAMPTYKSSLPINSREDHTLHLSTNTTVENMIEAALNKYNTERKSSTKSIPFNFTVIDKNTMKNLIDDLPDNETTTKEKNLILKSLLEKGNTNK